MSRGSPLLIVAAFLTVLTPAEYLRAQNAETPTRFEVASVKVNPSGDGGRMLGPAPGGRFVATNVTLRQLIAFAFGISNSRSEMLVIGGPQWLDADRFDVQAVAAGGNIPRGQTGPLVRALVEERFRLRAHRETRERPIYHLIVDRADGRLGPGLRPSTVDCNGGGPAAAGAAVPRVRCGLLSAPGMLTGLAVMMSQFAESIAPFSGRVVVDRTGLDQAFDIEFKWAADQRGATPDGSTTTPVAVDMPGLFTALKEQLGLKLEDARGPVDVVVVDSAIPLTPN
jgi:uncharacterized protein (TIGR03435 family)